MTERPQPPGDVKTMLNQLSLVLMGLVAILLALVILGALGDRYYTSKLHERHVELEKQEAFTQGITYEEFLRSLNASQDAQEGRAPREAQNAAGASTGQPSGETPAVAAETGAMPEPPVVPGQMVLPPPNLDMTAEELAALKKKAAIIHTTVGSFPVLLNAELAPQSVKNFVYLAQNRFYDGLSFFRIYPYDFLQGGSPSHQPGGTAGYWIDAENSPLAPATWCIAFLPSILDETKVGSEFAIFFVDSTPFAGQVPVFGRIAGRFDVAEKCADAVFDSDGMLHDRAFITTVEIVDAETLTSTDALVRAN